MLQTLFHNLLMQILSCAQKNILPLTNWGHSYNNHQENVITKHYSIKASIRRKNKKENNSIGILIKGVKHKQAKCENYLQDFAY